MTNDAVAKERETAQEFLIRIWEMPGADQAAEIAKRDAETRRVAMEKARDERQRCVAAWVASTFGIEAQASNRERISRFVEEALELAQSAALSREDVVAIADVVFSRPAGIPTQEAGGVGLTLLAYCESFGFSADRAEQAELDRVLAKSADHFRRRQQEKHDLGISMPPAIRAAAAAGVGEEGINGR